VEPSGGFEADFIALVRPHSPPLSFYVFFFWVEAVLVVILKLTDGAVMAPPPLVAARHVWFIVASFYRVVEFARSFSFSWIKFGVERWSRWVNPPSPVRWSPPAMGGRRPDLREVTG
jgi:hypothetical protein